MPQLVFEFTGKSTDLQQTITVVRSMLTDLSKSASQPANPGQKSGISAAIDQQRKQLALMKGDYDGITAAAIEFRRKGAPQELITQYVRLRREILANEAASAAAAAKKKAEKDAELALLERNAAYEASQVRLSASRQAAMRQNQAVSGGRGGAGGRGMANGMMFPMAMNSLAVGFQDAVSVYQVNGSALAAISAAGNNIIFLLTLMNPLAGAIGAITIGLTQLGVAWLTSGDDAEESAKKQEEAAKKIEDGLKRQLELRESLRKGDASEIDGEVNDLRAGITERENNVTALKQMLKDLEQTPENQLGGAQGKFDRQQSIEKLIDENNNEAMEKRSALAIAEELQKKVTPLMRNADRRNDSGQSKTISGLQEELKVLNGKMTEREAFIAKEVRGGGSRVAAGEEFDLREQIKAKEKEKEDAKDAAKQAERDNETAAKKKEADQKKRESEATTLRERLMNPNERYQNEVGKFRAQYDAGDIDGETFKRAERDARKKRDDELMQKIPERVTHAPSLLKGTVEAARVASTGRRDEKTQQLQEQLLAEAKRQTRIQERAFRNPLQKAPVAKEY